MCLTHSVTRFALCTRQHARAAPSATQYTWKPIQEQRAQPLNPACMASLRCQHYAGTQYPGLSSPGRCRPTRHAAASGVAATYITRFNTSSGAASQPGPCSLSQLTVPGEGVTGFRHCPLYAPHKGRTAGQCLSACGALLSLATPCIMLPMQSGSQLLGCQQNRPAVPEQRMSLRCWAANRIVRQCQSSACRCAVTSGRTVGWKPLQHC